MWANRTCAFKSRRSRSTPEQCLLKFVENCPNNDQNVQSFPCTPISLGVATLENEGGLYMYIHVPR